MYDTKKVNGITKSIKLFDMEFFENEKVSIHVES